MGFKMRGYAEEARQYHYRGTREADKPSELPQQAPAEALRDVTVFDLMTSFKKVLVKMENDPSVFRMERIDVTIEQQVTFTMDKLREQGRSSFYEICSSLNNRIKIIVTFLAILEMLKDQKITLYLEDNNARTFYLDLPQKKQAQEVVQ
jgi:segregation and condensation protein A